MALREWAEDDHPRDEHGRFSGGGLGAWASKKEKADLSGMSGLSDKQVLKLSKEELGKWASSQMDPQRAFEHMVGKKAAGGAAEQEFSATISGANPRNAFEKVEAGMQKLSEEGWAERKAIIAKQEEAEKAVGRARKSVERAEEKVDDIVREREHLQMLAREFSGPGGTEKGDDDKPLLGAMWHGEDVHIYRDTQAKGPDQLRLRLSGPGTRAGQGEAMGGLEHIASGRAGLVAALQAEHERLGKEQKKAEKAIPKKQAELAERTKVAEKIEQERNEQQAQQMTRSAARDIVAGLRNGQPWQSFARTDKDHATAARLDGATVTVTHDRSTGDIHIALSAKSEHDSEDKREMVITVSSRLTGSTPAAAAVGAAVAQAYRVRAMTEADTHVSIHMRDPARTAAESQQGSNEHEVEFTGHLGQHDTSYQLSEKARDFAQEHAAPWFAGAKHVADRDFTILPKASEKDTSALRDLMKDHAERIATAKPEERDRKLVEAKQAIREHMGADKDWTHVDISAHDIGHPDGELHHAKELERTMNDHAHAVKSND